LSVDQRALLAVALDFHAWRALARAAPSQTAAALFAEAIQAAASSKANFDGRSGRRRGAPARRR